MRPHTLPISAALDEQVAAKMADQFAALSDTSRVRIVATLLNGEQRVSAIVAQVGLSQPVVSHHLRVLRQLRLVRTRKEGAQVFYSLHDDHIVDLFRRSLDHVQHED
jgi:ArsR family transcriptional regulator, lead/cadmium/zinc/bismuth-responsive transcriptional repressor